MKKIKFTIYTLKDISNQNIASKFFQILDNHKVSPEKINLYEPINKDFVLEEAIKMWVFEENGCYEEGKGYVGKAGGMLGKRKNPTYTFDITWLKRPDKKVINHITFFFTIKSFNQYRQEIELIFSELLDLTEAIYGYITHEDALNRQRVTGTLETSLPGIFWCNFFSSVYVEFFTKEKILNFPWFKVLVTNNRGLIVYLSKNPDKELINSEEYEIKAKKYLGEESFGNMDNYKMNPLKIQLCRVPKIF